MRSWLRKLILCIAFCTLITSFLAATQPPPVLLITRPTNTAVFEGGIIQIEASIQPTGRVLWVTFFAGTNLLGFDFTEPYSFNWTNPPIGRHLLRAFAQVRGGGAVESDLVHIQVGQVFSDRLARGPYLQCGSPSRMVVRWRTDWPCGTYLEYGTELDEQGGSISEPTAKTEHEVTLNNLSADTVHYYSIRTERNYLATGPSYRFRTAPRIGTSKPTRIWAIGDSGTANNWAMAVRDAFLGHANYKAPDVWLMLGDNAYESGTDVEYQRAVFEMYPTLLQQTALWPTIGNHDAPLLHDLPYLKMFTLPSNGEAGGLPSGTERYYSFDYANIHFVCLDATTSSTRPGDAMLRWLESDLIATAQEWIIAFWHYPPYSKGSHNSDTEIELIRAREDMLPVLESYGVDLVLTGHSHNYERSYLLNGHYGHSSTFRPEMILDARSGQLPSDGPYRKPLGPLGDRRGCVYVVCGCSGEGGAISVGSHPANLVALGGYGSMVIDVNGSTLTALFIREHGDIDDRFTIVKDPAAVVQPRLHMVRSGDKAQLVWPAVPLSILESASSLLPLSAWRPVTNAVGYIGRRNVTEVSLSETQQVFRLRR